MSPQPLVLISDDEPLLVRALSRRLKGAGFSFVWDTTGERVLELARDTQPDVIILDVNQHLDGRDLLAKLKHDPRTSHIRVIMLSARDDEHTRHTCLELGAEDFESKPFNVTFVNKVTRLAEAAQQSKHTAEA